MVRLHGPAYRAAHHPPPAHGKILSAIERCRTEVLGGHIDICDQCGLQRNSYNSCRSRHCPKCQTTASAKWVAERSGEILPVGYFHLVFTLPHELNPIILTNKEVMHALLFESVSATLLEFGRRNFGGQMGFTTVLHTWDQQLKDHFHLHCLVPAGALTKTGWKHTPRKFLFPTVALAKVFRAKYLEGLNRLHGKLRWVGGQAKFADRRDFSFLENVVRSKRWVVYAKAPFGKPTTIVEYLGRYTHRVALSNGRILAADGKTVRFLFRNRRAGDKLQALELNGDEFLRRFLLHELPKGFVRIRHYGFMANRAKEGALERCRKLLGSEKPRPLTSEARDRTHCPQCPGNMIVAVILPTLHERWSANPNWKADTS